MRLLNNKAQMGMVAAAVGLFITLIIAVLIYYNVAPSAQLNAPGGTAASDVYGHAVYNASLNATEAVNTQAATFFSVAPIIGIVIVAVVVISYVQRIG